MPVPIPYAVNYTAEAGGTVWKVVVCEHCGQMFAYQMERLGTGEGQSLFFLNNQGAQERARKAAHQNLLQKLETEFDAVPCPGCDKYQKFMFGQICWERWVPRAWGSFFLFFLAALLGGLAYLFSISSSYQHNPDIPLYMKYCLIGAAVLIGVGILWLIVSAVFCWRYDPNNTAEQAERVRLAALKTVSGETLEKLIRDTQARLGNSDLPKN
jgi:hypothetical protein